MESAPACETFRFLVDCVRTVFAQSTSSAHVGRDRASIDWGLLQALARENRVDVLLLHGLQTLDAAAPPEVLASLRTYEQQNRSRNAASDEMLATILGALAERSIPSLVFKGPFLARAYPDPGMRFFWDLDLLVPRARLSGVHDAVVSLGYQREALTAREERLYMRYHFAHTYYPTAADRPEVDVHWSLFPVAFPVAMDCAGLWSRAHPVEIGGVGARTFSREDLLVYVALHGAKEEWRRLQMVADVAALLASAPAIDWKRCLRIADESHARRQLVVALHLAARVLGATMPAELAQATTSDPAVAALADDALWRQSRLFDRGTSIFHFSRWRMLSFERPIDRARYCWRTVSTPRLEHLALVDSPLLPLATYAPISLLHDYVAIPLRNWGRRSVRKLARRTP